MKLVKSSFEVIDQELKPTEVSLISKLINDIKFLEYITIYLKFTSKDSFKGDYLNNKFSVSISKWVGNIGSRYRIFYITTNLKELLDNDWLDDLQYICEPTEYHERTLCVKFNIPKDLISEFTKFKQFDFQVKQNCKDLTFIIPHWIDIPEDKLEKEVDSIEDIICYVKSNKKWDTEDLGIIAFLKACNDAEFNFNTLINYGWTYQQAAEILPSNIKSELIMIGFILDWKSFFECANPRIKKLIKPLKRII